MKNLLEALKRNWQIDKDARRPVKEEKETKPPKYHNIEESDDQCIGCQEISAEMCLLPEDSPL